MVNEVCIGTYCLLFHPRQLVPGDERIPPTISHAHLVDNCVLTRFSFCTVRAVEVLLMASGVYFF